MGGYGSGLRIGGSKKDTVEDSWVIDVNWMIRQGIFDHGRTWGSITWTSRRTGEVTSSLGYEVDPSARWLRLQYRIVRLDESFDYRISLTTTPMSWGGVRWWLRCPLVRGGASCGRRVGKLYRPTGARYYGCRTCYDLTYESCQESHKYDRVIGLEALRLGVTPAELRAAVDKDAYSMWGWEEDMKKRDQRRKRRRHKRTIAKANGSPNGST